MKRPPRGCSVAGTGLAAIGVVVLLAGAASASNVTLSPPWQRTAIGITQIITSGSGTFSNGFSSSVPSTSSGTWYTYAFANTQNAQSDQYAVEGVYYVNSPAGDLKSGSVDPQEAPTVPNAGNVVLGITCTPHVVAAGTIQVWINESYNVYDSHSNNWLYSSPVLAETSGNSGAGNLFQYTLSGTCPQSYKNVLLTPSWALLDVGQNLGSNPSVHWANDCGTGGLYNCTIVLYFQMAFSLTTINDVFANACFVFTIAAYPAACYTSGLTGSLSLGQVVDS